MEERLKAQNSFMDFILREWLLVAALSGLVITSLYLRRLPALSKEEVEVVFILAALFMLVEGLRRSGVVLRLSRRIERGGAVPLKLVLATFFLSMVVTNDVALIVIVPLTLLLNSGRKDVIVILEVLAANAGSALTPFGNPQNLFIYWYFGVDPLEFVSSIAPLSLSFLVLLALASLVMVGGGVSTGGETDDGKGVGEVEEEKIDRRAVIYGVLLVVLILTVLHVLPVWAGGVVIIYTLVFDRRSLVVDYSMLITFVCFFALAENMKVIFSSRIEHPGHIFIFSALASQVISNVPSALILAKFTTRWKALLWGSNVGGFGSLIGSFANLIAYRLYVTHRATENHLSFTIKFLAFGYAAFFIGAALYFVAGM